MQLNKGKRSIRGGIVVSLFLLLFATIFFGALETKAAEGNPISINLSNVAKLSSTTDYSVAKTNNVIELLTENATYELTGTMTGHVIVRKDCTVILNNVNITAGAFLQPSPYKSGKEVGTAALSIQGNTTCTVKLAGSNSLTGKGSFSDGNVLKNSAGIYVENTINTVAVDGDAVGTKRLASIIIEDSGSGTGKLTATGGTQSAAIGGNVNRATGNIRIDSGEVKAIGGSWSTGLGDGDSEKNSSNTDIIKWACVENNTWKKGDTCQPANITINDGNIWAEGKDAAPAIGTSDELSGDSSTTGNGSGVRNRVWTGQTITINGGTTICVGGGPSNASYTSIGAGRYSILSPGQITINQNESKTTRLIAVSKKSGYTINNSGMADDQEHPDISSKSTANVFSFKYGSGFEAQYFNLVNALADTDPNYAASQEAVDFVNAKMKTEEDLKSIKVLGLALVLPDGHYTMKVENSDIADVELEGGGLVYGDASNPIYTFKLDVLKDGKAWNNYDKTFVLKKDGADAYLTTLAVGKGTYTVYEKISDTKYRDTGKTETITNKSVSVTLDYFTVNFWDNPEDSDEKIYNSQIIFKGTTATIPSNPTKDGYTFASWSEDISKTLIEDTTNVYASWTANAYSVHFNKNAPEGKTVTGTTGDANNKQSFTYDDEAKALAANGFACEGYTFKGWSKEAQGVYSGNGTATWNYQDKEAVKNLATEGTAELYAVWEKNAVINGNVTIEYSYLEEGDTSGDVKVIPEGSRAASTKVELWRKVSGTNEAISLTNKDVAFDPSDPTTEKVSGEDYLVSSKDFSFTGYPATDADGNAYEYYTSTALSTYDMCYPDENNKLEMRLVYTPGCITVPIEVGLGDTFNSVDNLWPQEVYVKVVYRNHDADDWTAKPAAKDGDVISQHGGEKDALDGTYVACTWDNENKVYKGSYPVWLYSINENHEKVLYDYHIAVVGYKLSDTVVKAVGDAGFSVAYDDTTAEAFGDGTGTHWVYCKDITAETKIPSGIIRAELDINNYDITYYLNDDETDEAKKAEGTPGSYTYGTGVESIPSPTRPHYDFDGWYGTDEEGNIDLDNKIESISDLQIGNLELQANWTPKSYDIIYEVGDKGTAIDNGSYTYGEGLAELPTAEANDNDGVGYIFDGWYIDDAFEGEEITSIGAGESGEITLHAKWAPITYSIVFHKNNPSASADAEMESMEMKCDETKALTENAYSAAGYVFKGWATTANATSATYEDKAEVSNLSSTNEATVNLYAVWSIVGTVNINNTYELEGETITAVHVAEEANVILMRRLANSEDDYVPVTEKEVEVTFDYETEGQESAKATYDFDEIPMADEDGNLYEYCVSTVLSNYNTSYGGTEDAPSANGIFDVNLKFDPKNFTVDFAVDATALKEAEATLPKTISVKILYREFKADSMDHDDEVTDNELTITQHKYVSIPATLKEEDSECVYVGSYDVWKHSSDTATPYDYQIKAVAYLDEEGEAEQAATFSLGGYGPWVYYNSKTDKASAVMTATLKATYDIDYRLRGGEFAEGASVPESYDFGTEISSLPEPRRTGHTFEGWYMEGPKDGQFIGDPVEGISKSQVEDVTLYASWEAIEYNINYNLNDSDDKPADWKEGEEPVEGYTYGEGLSELPEPECPDYTFDGWYNEPEDEEANPFTDDNKVTSITDNQTGDVNLIAKWVLRESEVKITFKKDGEDWTEDTPTITLKDKDGNPFKDLTEVPNGKYIIIVDGRETAETITVNDANEDGNTKELAFYTLTVCADTGCENAIGTGFYLANEGVNIQVDDVEGYCFTKWTANPESYTIAPYKQLKISMPDYPLTLTANGEKYTSQVRINVNLNNAPWTEGRPVITLRRNEEGGKSFEDLGNIPNGEYKILADGVDTKLTITVNNKAGVLPEETLNYYTLTIVDSEGVHSVNGSGNYLAGDVAAVIAEINENYCFDGWESSDPERELETKNGKIIMDRPLTLTPKTHAPTETEEGGGEEETKFCCYTVNHFVLDAEGACPEEPQSKEMLHCESDKVISLRALRDGTIEEEGVIRYSHGEMELDESQENEIALLNDTLDEGDDTVTIKDKATINLYYVRSAQKYTLTLVSGEGTDSVVGGGTYAPGEEVAISAALPEDYIFTKWSPDLAGYQEYNAREATITMPASNLILTAQGMLRRSSVVIDADKDDNPWGDAEITLVDKDGKIIEDFDSVPDGEYHVYVNGQDTGAVVEVAYDSGLTVDKNLKFYTLNLERGTGIGKVTGNGVYVAGMAVPISAEVETGYNFTMWNGYKDTAISTLTTTFQMPAESVTLKANAVMQTTNNGEAGSTGAYETRHSDVKTGDLSTPIIWMLLLLGSALVGSAVLILKRKRK